MKVKKIAEAIEEYKRLGNLISEIEKVLEKFNKVGTSKDGVLCTNGTLMISGFTMCDNTGYDKKFREESVDVVLSSSISQLVRKDVESLLQIQLVELKSRQKRLEV